EIEQINVYFSDSTNAVDLAGNEFNNTIYGNDGQNTITGGLGDDWLIGFGNDDTLIGGIGNDLLEGGTGPDILNGGVGDDIYVINTVSDITEDTILEQPNGGVDTVRAAVDYTLGANVENLELSFFTGAVRGTGNAVGNYIRGNELGNILDGGAGDDTLD